MNTSVYSLTTVNKITNLLTKTLRRPRNEEMVDAPSTDADMS